MSARAAPYNSGIAAWAVPAGLRDRLGDTRHAASGRGVVFAHTVGMPYRPGESAIVQGRADCIYCEIPWVGGWRLFHARAGIAPLGKHAEYLAAVKRTIIDAFEKPTFIVGARRDTEFLSHHPIRPILLHGARVWLAACHVESTPAARDTAGLLLALAQQYRGVYDFGCGYGGALRPFRYRIGSDIDLKCLDYVARELL